MANNFKPVVLIVEDELIVAAFLQLFLESKGCIVAEIAATGERAVDAASRHNPDIVLMDINLAGKMNGVEAAHRIGEHSRVPFVFLSAHAGFYRDVKIGENKVVVLDKPFEEQTLLAFIHRLTGSAA